MNHISGRFTAVLDANVLYPFVIRDVLLSFADAGLDVPIWSERIMSEWQESLLRSRPEKREQILRTAEIMTHQFPEALVEGYEGLIETLDLPDPDDRHVLAAAIRGGAHAIVTSNLRDCPVGILATHKIEACTPDEFILSRFELYKAEAIGALRVMRARYTAPPLSPEELRLALIRAGLVQTAAEMRAHLELL